MERRVVITGLGLVSPAGLGARSLWDALTAGRSALGPVRAFDASGFACRAAGEVSGFSAKDFVPKHYRKAVKVMARDTELAVGAAKLAAEDAGLVTRAALGEDADPSDQTYPSARLGCNIGAGLIAAETDELTSALVTAVTPEGRGEAGGFDLRAWGQRGTDNLQPLWMLKYLPNMPACHVTIIHGAEGPSNTLTCAQASGVLSLGESVRVIQRGDADASLAGGAESKVNLMGVLRMTLAGRLGPAEGSDQAWRAVRPFDPSATGGVPGEAGGILVLEARDLAERRGARAYAEIVGFGAGHSPAPGPGRWPWQCGEGPDLGLRYAIENALADAGVDARDIDAIVPMGAGVPGPDAGEAGALRAVFGAGLARVPMVTLTPNIGDTFAGAGAVMAVTAALCLREQALPARLHAGTCPPDLGAGPAPSGAARLRHVLVCVGGLGGQNAALVLRAA